MSDTPSIKPRPSARERIELACISQMNERLAAMRAGLAVPTVREQERVADAAIIVIEESDAREDALLVAIENRDSCYFERYGAWEKKETALREEIEGLTHEINVMKDHWRDEEQERYRDDLKMMVAAFVAGNKGGTQESRVSDAHAQLARINDFIKKREVKP